MSPDMLIVYTATICQPCTTAKKRLEAAGVPFHVINIEEDTEALAHLKTSLGVAKITTPMFRWKGTVRAIDVLREIIDEHKEKNAHATDA